jgi:drug/metabolite transporter (DMT)-like permease
LLAIALALAASACWGTADFVGGIFSRRMSALVVLLTIEVSGLVVVALIVAATAEPLPAGRDLVLAALAGTAGITALGTFYRALAVGTMSIVAPISATGAILPVIVGVATGDDVTVLLGLGLALTLAGVVLASREEGEGGTSHASRQGIVLALAAAVGFGAFFVLFDSATDDSLLWPVLVSRLVAVPLVGGLVLVRRPSLPRGRDLAVLCAAGLLDLCAMGLIALANREGALSVVSVIASLYPVMTVLLAQAVLSERIRASQAAGVVLAFAGVATVSLASA